MDVEVLMHVKFHPDKLKYPDPVKPLCKQPRHDDYKPVRSKPGPTFGESFIIGGSILFSLLKDLDHDLDAHPGQLLKNRAVSDHEFQDSWAK